MGVRFTKKKESMEEYIKILQGYAQDGNKSRFSSSLRWWAEKNKRSPKMIYTLQKKLLGR